jgi:CBS domain-containing protein
MTAQDPAATSALVVADVMSVDPVVVDVDAPIEVAERLMHEHGISGLPVIGSDGSVVGVISQTDVIEDGTIPTAILLRRKPSGLRVGELMTSPAITVTETTSLIEAARRMRDDRIHRVVAVDDHGRPAGVLSASDFVALYADG